WYRDMLIKFDHLFVQDEKSVQLLREAGINRCSVAGDTRIDRVVAIAGDAKNIPLIEKFKGKSLLIVGGSTWKPDEDLLSKYINSSKDVKIIFAPHEVSETNIKRLQKIIEVPSVRFSKSDIKDIANYKVLIIDSIGLLSSIYKYGSVAYIGGGFGVGIHNILEPAVFGLPVIFGPNHEKFKEATDLKALKGAYPVNNFRQLENVLNMFLNNLSALLTASDICRSYILKNIGAANIIINKVFNN
ncbi:MAG: 3-deoxy-D-manno-octulosonic acid transferase, partial [Bacteroidales bacterium]|nr:3-deoxy-D-manno-octulosonic acid transferase [Bacteroidales bacterium]